MASAALITVAAVAELLSTTTDHVLALIHTGKLPAIDIALPGKRKPRWRVAVDALERFTTPRTPAAIQTPARRTTRQLGMVEFYSEK